MEKKKWSKPECSKVRLIAEEAMLVGCKSRTSAIKTHAGLGCTKTGAQACAAISGS